VIKLEECLRQTIDICSAEQHRSGSFSGYNFNGLNCEEGWIFSFFRGNSNIRTQLWVKGPFESPSFYYIDAFKYEGQSSLETSLEKVEPTPEERMAILGMIGIGRYGSPLRPKELAPSSH
jgi:hypothetical protein